MIYNGNYEKYIKLYRKNIKSISHRSYRKSYKINDPIAFHQSSPNYDLYYDKTGRLIQATEYKFSLEMNGKARELIEGASYIYTYNFKGQLIHIVGFISTTHELRQLVDLEYDNNKLIREGVQNFDQFGIDYKEYIHEYGPLYHKLTYDDLKPYFQNLKEGEDQEQEIIVEEFFNEKGQVTETKYFTELEGLHSWECNVYNERGQIIEEYSLDEDAKIYSKCLLTYFKNNLVKSEYISNQTSIYWEYRYDMNSKGDWIKQIGIKNSEIYGYDERDIEYFE